MILLADSNVFIKLWRGEDGKEIAPIFEYLDAVFSSDIETIDKFTPASANPEIAKEVAEMPGMSQAILERGKREAIVESIKNLMANMKWTIEQAMDALSIPADQRTTIAGMVNKK